LKSKVNNLNSEMNPVQNNMSKSKQIDDLTPEEIKDIEDFRNSDGGETRTLKELLQELNE